AWVVCDRFADSTRAYQGAGEAVDPTLISALEARVLDGVRPDLTIVLDLPIDVGLARARARADAQSRFEAKGRAFHERLRQAFIDIARTEPARCAVISADAPENEVAEAVWETVQSRLGA